jgi:hypothetical protein
MIGLDDKSSSYFSPKTCREAFEPGFETRSLAIGKGLCPAAVKTGTDTG